MSFKGFSNFSHWPFCSAEQNHFSNFGRGSSKKHFCELILKPGHWPRRRCCLKKLLTDGRTDGQIDGGMGG